MTITLQRKDLIVELSDEESIDLSEDSVTAFDKVIQANKDIELPPTSEHFIRIYKDNNLLKSAIIQATGGATSIQTDSALIDEDNLIIRCCNKLFSLSLPELEINWAIEPDWATCFSIYKYKDTYISHGEASIARISRDGKILWSFGGADIFVCLYEGNPFQMHETFIALTDFTGSTYRIDYDGNSFDYWQSDYYNREAVSVEIKSKKQWWKFW